MATRFSFQNTSSPSVSPAYDGNWDRTDLASRWALLFTKGSDAIAAGTTISVGAGNTALDRQYVTTRLKTGTVFDTSWTVKAQLMTREFAGTDDVNRMRLCIKVVSEDGGTIRATLLNNGVYGTVGEFLNNATHRNCTGANGDAFTGSYTTVYGDRLVVEIGYHAVNTGTTPQAAAKWGENATDLPEDDTQTTDGAGWIEFSGTIESGASEIMLTGVSAATAVGTLIGDADELGIITGISAATALGTLNATGTQTRFYFQNSLTTLLTPSFDSNWDYTTEASRWGLNFTKGSDAITIGTRIGPFTAGGSALDRQYISGQLVTGTAFSTHWTIKGQLMVREYAGTDDVVRIQICIKVVSNDGTTTRATLLSTNFYGTEAEFINNVTHRNAIFADGDHLASAYTTVFGDRLVIEIGYKGNASGTTPEASAKWGDDADDLPEDDTQTTDGAGWIEFSGLVEDGSGEDQITLTGIAASAAVGTLTATGDAQATLSGVDASCAVGTLSTEVIATPTASASEVSHAATTLDGAVFIHYQRPVPHRIAAEAIVSGNQAVGATGKVIAAGGAAAGLIGQAVQLSGSEPVSSSVRNLSDDELLLFAFAA